MTNENKNKIIGGSIVVVLFGVPLAIFFGPIAVIVFIVTLVIALSKKKQTLTRRTEEQAQADELIAVILPTIDPKK